MVRQNWRVWRSSFPVSDLEDRLTDVETLQATTFGGYEGYRKSRVAWLTHDVEIRKMMLPYIKDFREVSGIQCSDFCEIQYTEYHAEEGGKYDWHHDVDWNDGSGIDRKLSLTVQLSAPNMYEGGDFQFSEVEQPPEWYKDKGTVLVFPSYLQHRVLPVTWGVRKSLVAWFAGDAWK